jgi:hypothetical protein
MSIITSPIATKLCLQRISYLYRIAFPSCIWMNDWDN